MSVMNFLSINRVDQAEKQLKAMAALDEDATVTQLAMAWVNIYLVRPTSSRIRLDAHSCGMCQPCHCRRLRFLAARAGRIEGAGRGIHLPGAG